ncbi:hypothetical protein [Macellibacteroides fermentans]|jgi:hypothetical protein|uniref:hypothetical protein n=1 Tax=Macellibacteroides fermentans TaxID=879969 RepID=UPI00406C14A6|nr:hypothetical protein [Parabacteroides sp.]
MRKEKNILKQNSLGSGIIIKLVAVVVWIAFLGLLSRSGGTISLVVAGWLIWKLLRLFFKFVGLLFSLFLTVVSIGIILIIITLLIF